LFSNGYPPPIKEFDEMMLDWLSPNWMKVHVLLNKIGTSLKRGQAKSTHVSRSIKRLKAGVDATVQTSHR